MPGRLGERASVDLAPQVGLGGVRGQRSNLLDRSLDRRFGGFGGPTRFGHRSATLNFALRARGLTATSSADATTGLRVRTVSRGSSRKATFTRRSSSEWKLMMAARPPGTSRSG